MVVSILPSLKTVVMDNFEESRTAGNIPGSIAEAEACESKQ